MLKAGQRVRALRGGAATLPPRRETDRALSVDHAAKFMVAKVAGSVFGTLRHPHLIRLYSVR
jgi:hypothetical protein